MNNSQVAHLWANQSRDSARGSNFYFRDSTIYSYGSHFPIARHIERAGRKAILFTTRGHSISTARHISYTCNAISDSQRVFHVYNPLDVPKSASVRDDYAERLNAALKTLVNARTHKDTWAEQAGRIAREGNECAEFFGWSWRLTVPHFTDEWRAEQRAKYATARRKQAEQEKRLRAGLTAKWRAGGTAMVPGSAVLLRVSKDGERIETSRGAHIPVAHAARLWRRIEQARAGNPYQHNGHSEHAGEFRIDSIDTDGTLRAGCHTILYPELALMAKALGLASA